jgi:hypothetical protein
MRIKRCLSLAAATIALSGAIATAAQAEVIVDKVYCFEENDNFGSDDIYTVTFRGNTTGDFNNNVGVKGPGDFWDDFDSGEYRDTDVVQSSSNPGAVYVVMAVEQDDGLDIAGEALDAFRAQLNLVWKAQMFSVVAAGGNPSAEAERQAAAAKIKTAMNGLASIYMNFPKGNDDSLGIARINIAPGQIVYQDYWDADFDGHYRFKFKN